MVEGIEQMKTTQRIEVGKQAPLGARKEGHQ